MTTLANIAQAVYDRTGLTDSNSVQVYRALNRAGEEVCSVQWDFLYSIYSAARTTSAAYTLPATVAKVDRDNVYITLATGVNTKLLEGWRRLDGLDYIGGTESSNILFILEGTSGTSALEQVKLSSVLSTAVTYLNVGHWIKHGTYTAAQEPLISKVYGDMPLISCACAIVWKEMEQNAKATDAFLEFAGDMRIMESKKTFTGMTYDQIVQLRDQVAQGQAQ